MNTFLEGAEAIRLPCTLALLIPAVAVVLAAGRRATFALVGFAVGAALIAWARFADGWIDSPNAVVSFVLGVGVAGSVLAIWRSRVHRNTLVPALGITIGAITAWLWEPCVGRHLGATINRAPQEPFSTFAPTFAYIAGALLVAAAIAIAPLAAPRLATISDHRVVRLVGATAGVLIGAAIAMGLYDNLVAELLRSSRI